MKIIRPVLRAIAITAIFPAIVQVLSPLAEFFLWLRVLLTPNESYTEPTTLQVGSAACRQLTISLACLSMPLLLWLIAGISRGGSNPAAEQKADSSN